jgi:hypothetical protein
LGSATVVSISEDCAGVDVDVADAPVVDAGDDDDDDGEEVDVEEVFDCKDDDSMTSFAGDENVHARCA